jgi:hypothetical protein
MPQPTPPASPAPPAAQSPRAPTAVALPEGTIPLGRLPQSPQEIRGLRERRDILRDQMDRAVNRRNDLVRQLRGDEGRPLPPEARTGIQQRLEVLDARILQIERDQATTERLLSNAPADVLAMAAAESRSQGPTVDEDEAVASGFAAFGFGVLLTLVVGRLRRRFARRRARSADATALPADDPRIERLAHAVDAIAEEVERIGEGQRFVTQLLAARPAVPVTAPVRAAVEGERG